MGTELVLPKGQNRGAEILAANMSNVLHHLNVPGVTPQQFALSVMVAANSLTKQCVPNSVVMAALHSAVTGLIPAPGLGHAYFIPYFDKRQQANVCTFVPGYKGLLELAFANAFLIDVHCDVVLNGEEWRHWKDAGGPQLLHEIPLERNLVRDNVLASYCIYHTRGGGKGVKVATRQQLDRVDTKINVWKSDYIPMAMKSAVRQAAKEWRLSQRAAIAIELDEQQERGEAQHVQGHTLDDVLEDGDFSLDDVEVPGEEAEQPDQDEETEAAE